MELFTTIEKHGQGHLIKHYESLPKEAQVDFLNQLKSIDFELIDRLYGQLVTGQQATDHERSLSPLLPDILTDADRITFEQLGIKVIAAGQVAALLLAGGQGSRLGHEGPKGTFDIGLASGASLFQLHIDSLKRVEKTTGTYIDFYIMTSDTNHDETVAYFVQNGYFGYPREKVTFFRQGMLPAVDFSGRIIIESEGKISFSPDGNGGCFVALGKSGVMRSILDKGIKWLFLFGIDNAITDVCDPVFVGYTEASMKQSASKVVKKISADEKVGVLCYDHLRPSIVEYSEMSEQDTRLTDEKGELVYSNANILNHLIRTDVLNDYLTEPMQYHLAVKKIKHITDSGVSVTPDKSNGYKYESFIFDIFPFFTDMGALQVSRELEFAPVKNKEGADSPQTAKALYMKKYK
ncbi:MULTISPECIES: UDPGP type 1 family protein [unclassified Fusibacter]|uniref:UTP--glucose-1-phosphate uridylyltransferase n=1 Tax=unclassified Fusibacter TaxID=2624464 RepID=UPI001012356B|nr:MULTISPECIES: UDPGP type 1 family protein [unclassified Fusibacter]MCK8059025.1 UDPGP type 1 family protein [Fusibacter sp. A2]NPE22436.1 UDPGP type 1 family protein [Fusibacter sp. A1]RXV60541.1 UDPGP type 1 family protein [Fusibacter sp. A1]